MLSCNSNYHIGHMANLTFALKTVPSLSMGENQLLPFDMVNLSSMSEMRN